MIGKSVMRWFVCAAAVTFIVGLLVESAQAEPGWASSTHRRNPFATISNLAQADLAINTGIVLGSGVTPTVNDLDTAGAGNFGGDVRPFGLPATGSDDFAVRHKGFLTITQSGNYQFRNNNDDGSRLRVDLNRNGVFDAGETLINDDTNHGPANRFSAPVVLGPGVYMIEHVWYERGGGAEGESAISKDNGAFFLFGNPAVATSAFAQYGVSVDTATSSPPIADAGPDQRVNELASVALNGTGSHDTNTPLQPITYAWTQASGPAVTLANGNTATPSFTAPSVPREGAVLVFNLSVSNGATTPATDSVTVNVDNVNSPPAADAGSPQDVPENSLVTLHGTGSDPDGDSLTLSWTQTGGPVVVLSGADTVAPTFTAPAVTSAQGSSDLQFTLTVNDGLISSGPSTVTVRVMNVNGRPTATAGTGQSVNELDPVTLDGSQSSDPDHDPLSYAWTQISGPLVTLTAANTALPTFVAPAVTPGGATLTFELTVSDGDLSNTGTVNVQVNNVNHPPLADAGPDQTVPENTPVFLDGSNSADTDGDTLSYAWTQTDGPFVTLTDANTANPTFTTPDAGPAGAVLTFQLTVDDRSGGVASDTVVVNVTYVNRPPTVNAGEDQTVSEGATATLAATASDPDGNTLVYSWTRVSGPSVTLSNASEPTPSFTAPQVTRDEADVVLRLTVSDGYGGSASDDVAMHIANVNRPPVAQAPANLSVPEATPVDLIGQGTDPDSEEQIQLVYAWQQIAPVTGPVVHGATLSFTAPLVTAGGDPNATVTLTFRLTVVDPNGAAASDDVDVVVTNVDHAPTAKAGGLVTANEAASVTLNGAASSDPDGDALTSAWVQTAGPAVVTVNADTAYPSFTAPFVNAAGATLKFQLTVNDGFGGISSDVATVSVRNINDPPTCANTQASLGTLWPPNHSMVPVSILGVIDPNNNATITITGVTQDEPTNGLGDGDTAIDAIINTDGTVLLRAERSGKGNGRVYHLHFTASDFEGRCSGVVKVSVPHDKKGDVAIDGGELYDSTR